MRCEVDEHARARGHARLRAHEHGRVVCAHSIFFELRRKGVAGHRPRALLVWGVPHQKRFFVIIAFLCAKQKCAKNLTGFVLFNGFIHEVSLQIYFTSRKIIIRQTTAL